MPRLPLAPSSSSSSTPSAPADQAQPRVQAPAQAQTQNQPGRHTPARAETYAEVLARLFPHSGSDDNSERPSEVLDPWVSEDEVERLEHLDVLGGMDDGTVRGVGVGVDVDMDGEVNADSRGHVTQDAQVPGPSALAVEHEAEGLGAIITATAADAALGSGAGSASQSAGADLDTGNLEMVAEVHEARPTSTARSQSTAAPRPRPTAPLAPLITLDDLIHPSTNTNPASSSVPVPIALGSASASIAGPSGSRRRRMFLHPNASIDPTVNVDPTVPSGSGSGSASGSGPEGSRSRSRPFSETDYLRALPGDATFVEDADLSSGMGTGTGLDGLPLPLPTGPGWPPRRRLGQAPAAPAGPASGSRSGGYRGTGGRGLDDLLRANENDFDFDHFEYVLFGDGRGGGISTGNNGTGTNTRNDGTMAGSLAVAAGAGEDTLAGGSGSSLHRGGNNRRRISLRRSAANAAATQASGGAGADGEANGHGQGPSAQEGAEAILARAERVTSADIHAWETGRRLEVQAEAQAQAQTRAEGRARRQLSEDANGHERGQSVDVRLASGRASMRSAPNPALTSASASASSSTAAAELPVYTWLSGNRRHTIYGLDPDPRPRELPLREPSGHALAASARRRTHRFRPDGGMDVEGDSGDDDDDHEHEDHHDHDNDDEDDDHDSDEERVYRAGPGRRRRRSRLVWDSEALEWYRSTATPPRPRSRGSSPVSVDGRRARYREMFGSHRVDGGYRRGHGPLNGDVDIDGGLPATNLDTLSTTAPEPVIVSTAGMLATAFAAASPRSPSFAPASPLPLDSGGGPYGFDYGSFGSPPPSILPTSALASDNVQDVQDMHAGAVEGQGDIARAPLPSTGSTSVLGRRRRSTSHVSEHGQGADVRVEVEGNGDGLAQASSQTQTQTQALDEGDEERNKRPRLGNILPSPHAAELVSGMGADGAGFSGGGGIGEASGELASGSASGSAEASISHSASASTSQRSPAAVSGGSHVVSTGGVLSRGPTVPTPAPVRKPAAPRPRSPYPSYLSYYPHVPPSSVPLLFAKPSAKSNLALQTRFKPAGTKRPPGTGAGTGSGGGGSGDSDTVVTVGEAVALNWSRRASASIPESSLPPGSILYRQSGPREQFITFTDHPTPSRTDDDACALLTDVAIPPGLGVFYYEVKVLDSGPEGYMSVGFAKGDSNPKRLVGWEKGTWGYHADDGLIFEGSGKGRPFGDMWGVNDVIGAGIDFTTKRVFFTKNGALVGTGRVATIPSLHPAIALRNVQEKLQVNLCGPFVYDIDRYARNLKDRALQSVHAHAIDRVVPLPYQWPTGEEPLGEMADRVCTADPEDPRVGARMLQYADMTNTGRKAGTELALVLEYLAHRGMDKVAGLVKRDVRRRRLFDAPGPTLEGNAVSGEDKGKAAEKPGQGDQDAVDESIGKRFRDAIKEASSHPLRPHAERIPSEHKSFTLAPRLAVLDLAHDILASLDPVAITGPTAPDLSSIISQGRSLQQYAKLDWGIAFELDAGRDPRRAGTGNGTRAGSGRSHMEQDPRPLLTEAIGLLALSPPVPASVAAVWDDRRQRWMRELHEAIRREMGMGEQSLLETALDRTGTVMQALRDGGDGTAACVQFREVVGLRDD